MAKSRPMVGDADLRHWRGDSRESDRAVCSCGTAAAELARAIDEGRYRRGLRRVEQIPQLELTTIETDATKGAAVKSPLVGTGLSINQDTGAQARASTDGFRITDVTRTLNGVVFTMSGSASDPLSKPAPSVDYSFNISVSAAGTVVTVEGAHNNYPSFLGTVSNEAGQTATFLNSSEDDALLGPFSMVDGFDEGAVSALRTFNGRAACNYSFFGGPR